MSQQKLNLLISRLKNDLSEGRFIHSMGVAECAKELAERFSCDADKAYLAGLLHDCATKLTGEEMLGLALQAGLRTEEETSADPVADYHARLGAVIAERDYGITDPEVLNAIARHQVGCVGMSTLDIIISLADGIEPSRKGDKIEEIRAIAQTDLVSAYLEKTAFYITNIIKGRRSLSRDRVDTYNYLLQLTSIEK